MRTEERTHDSNTRNLLIYKTLVFEYANVFGIKLTWNPGNPKVARISSNDWEADIARVVSSSTCACISVNLAMKYPSSIKFSISLVKPVDELMVKAPSVSSMVPEIEHSLQVIVRLPEIGPSSFSSLTIC